jgi:hypothetical protein
VSQADKNAVRVKVASRKQVIEGMLSNGPTELRKVQAEAITTGKAAEARLAELAQGDGMRPSGQEKTSK